MTNTNPAATFNVTKTEIATRATRRTPRSGGSPSDGRGTRTAWIVVGPFNPADSYHNAIKSCSYTTKRDALEAVARLNGVA